MGSRKTAVAFFQTEYIVVGAGLLKQLDLLAYVLKSRQHFDTFYVIIIRNRFRHISCNDCRNKRGILRHLTGSGSFSQNILRNQHPRHVSGKGNIFAALRIERIDSQSVRIRVGREHDIRISFFCQFKRQRKGLRVFRIRIGKRCEIRVGHFLFRHNINILKADFIQNPSDRQISGSVKRRVYNLHIIRSFRDDFRMNDLLLQLRHILIVNFLSDYLIKPGFDRVRFLHRLYIMIVRHVIDFRNNLLISWRRYLCAVFPVAFIAVILRRIMACRNHNTGNTVKRTQRERQFRRRPKRFEYVSFDAVGRQTERRFIRKLRRHSSGVISDCHAFLFPALFLNIICQALCCFADSIDIHAVRSRADHTPQSAGTKCQLLIKTVFNFFLIIFDRLKFVLRLRVEIRIFQPECILFFVTHSFLPPSLFFPRIRVPSVCRNTLRTSITHYDSIFKAKSLRSSEKFGL